MTAPETIIAREKKGIHAASSHQPLGLLFPFLLICRYMGEFMSTRIGINRAGKVLAAAERTNADDQGRQFYDFLINIDSYAARNQYGMLNSRKGSIV